MYSGSSYTAGTPPAALAGRRFARVRVEKYSAFTRSETNFDDDDETSEYREFEGDGSGGCSVEPSGIEGKTWTESRNYHYAGSPPSSRHLTSITSVGSCSDLSTCGGTRTFNFSEPPTPTTQSTGQYTLPLGAFSSSSWAGTKFTAVYDKGTVTIEYLDEETGQDYQFRVDNDHATAFFEVCHNVVRRPADDPEATGTIVEQDLVDTWTGPGSGSQSDPSWLTATRTLDPPSGYTDTVEDIRYRCNPDGFWVPAG